MSGNDTLTAVPGLRVGHYTDLAGGTGCTVILAEDAAGMGCAVDVRGQAPGSREHALLAPGRLVERVHALLLTGGSAFGLAAADGVVGWLEARGIGFDVGVGVVPIVPASVLFDLALGPPVRPGPAAGAAACEAADRAAVAAGTVGAGTGCTVGKMLGPAQMMKAGLGSAATRIAGGAWVGALAAVNALGDVVDPGSGKIVAGARRPEGGFLDSAAAMRGPLETSAFRALTQTTLAVVATDAALDRAQLTMLAGAAQAGMARAINPVHTMMDGDTLYALSTGSRRGANVAAIAAVAADLLAEAILRGVRAATSLHGVPALQDLPRS